MITLDRCPLCQSHAIEQTMSCVDHYATGEVFDLYRCKGCGFCFTQHFPPEAEIGRYYESPDYISHTDTKRGLLNTLYHQVRSYMLRSKARRVEHYAKGAERRLLDVGTGTGYFAATMQQRGWRVSAIEKSAAARAYAQSHFGLTVMEDGTLDQLPSEGFDAITLWHVLEHIEPLKASCQELHRLLAPNGVLVLALPNASSYDARKYKEQWAAYDVPRHLWHFTPSTLQRLAAEQGFEVVAMHPMPFDAFYVSILSERYAHHKGSFVRGVWSGILGWIASLGKTSESSSIIYILKKSATHE